MVFMTNRATGAARLVEQSVPEGTVRDVCIAALEAVGRLKWDSLLTASFKRVVPSYWVKRGRYVDTTVGCVCYAAPVVFAVLGGAMSVDEADSLCNAPKTGSQKAQDAYLHHIYGRFAANGIVEAVGDQIPPGAMVFHGDIKGTPAAHVTMSIGSGLIVSCWTPGSATSTIDQINGKPNEYTRDYNQQLDEMEPKGLVPDTVILPVRAFTGNNQRCVLRHTREPFWHHWYPAKAGHQ